jgi:hypothetical protein
MFVGHLAVALAAKRSVPKVNLAWLVGAVTALDLVWPIFVLAGVERVTIAPGATAFNPLVFDFYPWSHSLAMACVWGALLNALARWRHMERSGARVLFLLVVSHWVLDFISHTSDMPLWPDAIGHSPRLGLGLWNSIPATYFAEGGMWLGAIVVYLSARPLRGWKSKLAFWSFTGVSTILWAAVPWSPPPPSEQALGWFAMIGWLMIPWAWAADRRAPAAHHV